VHLNVPLLVQHPHCVSKEIVYTLAVVAFDRSPAQNLRLNMLSILSFPVF
jgi:hypothetical protein